MAEQQHVGEIFSLGKEHKNVKTWRDTLELSGIDTVLEKSHSVPRMFIFSPAVTGMAICQMAHRLSYILSVTRHETSSLVRHHTPLDMRKLEQNQTSSYVDYISPKISASTLQKYAFSLKVVNLMAHCKQKTRNL